MQKSIFQLIAIIGVFFIALTAHAQSHAKETKEVAINRELGRSFVEKVINAKSKEAFVAEIDRLFSPQFLNHNVLAPAGREGLKGFLGSLGQSFPDGHATLLDVIATPDKVVARWNYQGTLTGQAFMGATAGGQKIDVDIIDIFAVKNGQFTEHWDLIDWVRALPQVGATQIGEPFSSLAKQPIKR